jgi:hypothetical protein
MTSFENQPNDLDPVNFINDALNKTGGVFKDTATKCFKSRSHTKGIKKPGLTMIVEKKGNSS